MEIGKKKFMQYGMTLSKEIFFYKRLPTATALKIWASSGTILSTDISFITFVGKSEKKWMKNTDKS